MSNRPPSRVVFVGNIPYGLSEEQISDIFARCGTVLNFRLVYDRETGKPKGFGFCEYPDTDSAESAVRNLHDMEIHGRKLRVDFSNEPGTVGGNNDDDRPQYDGHNGGGNGSSSSQQQQQQPPQLPPLPPGKDLPAGVSATDAISRTLRTLPPSQLLDILTHMKSVATTDHARATELLSQAPQLSYAIFQALLLMDLVSAEAIQTVMEPPATAVAPAAPPAAYGAYNSAAAATSNNNTPPVVAAPYAAAAPPPPSVAPQPDLGAPAAASQMGDTELVQRLLSLSQEVIDQLPEVERTQVLQLRAHLLGQPAR